MEGHQYSTKDQELEPEYQEQEEDGQEQDEPLLEELQELHNGSRIGNDDSVDTMRDLENIGRTLLPSPRVMETLVNEGNFEDEVIDKVYNESDHNYCANLEDTNISDHSYGKNDKQGKVSKPFGGRGGLFRLDQQSIERRNHFNSKMLRLNLNKFECRTCKEVLVGEERATRHANKKSCGSLEVECAVCDKSFSNSKKYNNHKLAMHGKLVTCEICGENCRGRRKLLEHSHLFHGNLDECSTCNKKFTRRHDWLRHVKRHQGLNHMYGCPHCEYKSERLANIKRHIIQKHNSSHKESYDDKNRDENIPDSSVHNKERGAKLLISACVMGEREVEGIIYVNENIVTLLKLLHKEDKQIKLIDMGHKFLEFKVQSIARDTSTILLVGESQIAVMTLGLNSVTVNVKHMSPQGKINLITLTKVDSRNHAVVGTQKSLRFFSIEEEGPVLIRTINAHNTEIVSFTTDNTSRHTFLLDKNGNLMSSSLLCETDNQNIDILTPAAEEKFSSVYYSRSENILYLVLLDGSMIYRGISSEQGVVTIINKVTNTYICMPLCAYLPSKYLK